MAKVILLVRVNEGRMFSSFEKDFLILIYTVVKTWFVPFFHFLSNSKFDEMSNMRENHG